MTFKVCYHVTLNTLFHCFSHIMCPRQTDFFKVRNTKEPARRWPEVPVLNVSALHSLAACPCRMLQVTEDPVLLVPFLYQVGQQRLPRRGSPYLVHLSVSAPAECPEHGSLNGGINPPSYNHPEYIPACPCSHGPFHLEFPQSLYMQGSLRYHLPHQGFPKTAHHQEISFFPHGCTTSFRSLPTHLTPPSKYLTISTGMFILWPKKVSFPVPSMVFLCDVLKKTQNTALKRSRSAFKRCWFKSWL